MTVLLLCSEIHILIFLGDALVYTRQLIIYLSKIYKKKEYTRWIHPRIKKVQIDYFVVSLRLAKEWNAKS